MSRIKRAVLALVIAGAVTGGSIAVAATSSGGEKSGKIKVFLTAINETKSKILVTGSIGDYGTATSIDKNGKVDANGAYEKVVLQHGGFVVNGTALNKKLDHSQPTVNRANCSVVFAGSAPTSLADGTGSYQGISGTIDVTLTFAGIGPRTAKGKCNFGNNVNPLGQYTSVTGSGSVKLPG